MKTLGVIGGMSWESTAVYYRLLNQGVAERRGGLHSAPLVLHSVDFAPVAALQAEGEWPRLAEMLAGVARALQAGGAQGLLLATNTMHKVAAAIAAATPGVPLLHIADATGQALRRAGIERAALLGTRFTMEDDSIVRSRLQQQGLSISVPPAEDRKLMHRVIYDELCRGQVHDGSRAAVVALIERQRLRGAQAVILGCTEIGLLIDAGCSPLPVFDTTPLHASAAVRWICEESLP
jgi:aspartate racemase